MCSSLHYRVPAGVATGWDNLRLKSGVKHLQAGTFGSCLFLFLIFLQTVGRNDAVVRADVDHPFATAGEEPKLVVAG